MSNSTPQITAKQLLALVQALPPRALLTETRFRRRAAKGAWSRWLGEYDRPGYYRRKQPGLFARQAYTHVKSPWLMMWLCEKLGASDRELRLAGSAAAGCVTKAAQAGAFRRVIPWQRVHDLLCQANHVSQAHKRLRRRIKTPRQLRRAVEGLSPVSPITDRFSAKWRRLADRDGGQQERKRVWYKTQHEHWLGWLEGQEGPGAYNRKSWNRSAEFVYEHVVNPQMLVYLAEAAGIDNKVVIQAVKAALNSRSSMPSMSAAIRRIVRWEAVEFALVNRRST